MKESTQVFEKIPKDFKPKAYITAAYVIAHQKLLLLQLSDAKKENMKWGVPAGKLEKGETPEEAMIRELYEETGIALESSAEIYSVGQLYIRKPEIDYIYHLFRIKFEKTPEIWLSTEHVDFRWALFSEIDAFPLMDGAEEALQFYIRSSRRSFWM